MWQDEGEWYRENGSKSGLGEEEGLVWSEREGGEEGRQAKSSHHYYQDSQAAPPVMEWEEIERERDTEKMEL